MREQRPFFGVCLGAQMMARHFGARVYSHPEGRTEVGYYPIHPTLAGLKVCPEWPGRVYQWHKEGFDVPADCELLAEGGDFPNQAIRYGNAFGVQFHPDITYAMMYRWWRPFPRGWKRPACKAAPSISRIAPSTITPKASG